MDLKLNGKVALVSGAHRGTGYVIAETLFREGATVAVHGFSQEDSVLACERLNKQPAGNARAIPVSGDILSDVGTLELKEQLKEIGLSVDILINNYGSALPGKWGSLAIDQWNEAINVNLYSAIRLTTLCTDHMKQKGWGRVVNLSTIGDHQPNSIMPHYYSAKAALSNTTVSLARELGGSGITVNTVSPGLIRTAEVEQAYKARAKKKGWPEDWESLEPVIVDSDFPNPSGRLATREEVADLVVFLASPRSGMINGQNIRVDGGAVRYV